MIAIKRLQSIMWILIVAAGALSAYLISLRVATERNAMTHVERQIYDTRAHMRYLGAEFQARASMAQLEAWNSADIKYTVPQADQYLPNERALASLGGIAPVASPYVPPPVMTAMAQPQPDAAPSSPAAHAGATAKVGLASAIEALAPVSPARAETLPAPRPPAARVADRREPGRDVSLADAIKATKPVQAVSDDLRQARLARAVAHAPAADGRTSRLAMLDKALLGDSGGRSRAGSDGVARKPATTR